MPWPFSQSGGINKLDGSGQNALHAAAKLGNFTLVQELLQTGAQINSRATDNKTALHFAAASGSLQTLDVLLNQTSVVVDAADDQRQTPLHVAAERGDAALAVRLYNKGANIQIRRGDGCSPVDLAVAGGHLNVLEALRANGVDFTSLNSNAALLHAAALSSNGPILEFLLARGIPVDVRLQGYTALMRTFSLDSPDMARILLDAGASIEERYNGASALLLSILGGHAATVDVLLHYNLDGIAIVNNPSSSVLPIEAAVVKATEGGDEEIIDLLMEAGANPLALSPGSGRSALEICAIKGRRDLAERIRVHLRKVESLEGDLCSQPFQNFLPHLVDQSESFPISTPLMVGFRTLDEDQNSLDSRRDFFKFDSNRGWDFSSGQPRRLNNKPYTEAQLASFLQEWLVLRLLNAIAQTMGMHRDCRKLLRRCSKGHLLFHTYAIVEYIQDWMIAEEKWQEDYASLTENDSHPSAEETIMLNITTRLGLINDILAHAANISESVWRSSDILVDLAGAKQVVANPIDQLGVVVVILGQCLSTVRDKIYSPELRLLVDKNSTRGRTAAQRFETTGWLPEDYQSINTFASAPRYLAARLLVDGVCPSEIRMLHTVGLKPTTIYFISLLSRPHMLQGHTHCSKYDCAVMQVDEKNYKTKHVDDKCDCDFVSVDISEVKARLANGKIPVVRFVDEQDGKGSPRLDVSDGSSKLYIAFSHVWAHGLGNPANNSLPKCQLRRLSQLANSAGEEASAGALGKDEVCFWIDTLCVPVDEIGRRQALRLLRNAYKESFVTLVLDQELMKASPASSHAERTARVLTSSWMRRLWTLEEALMSSLRLRYQFSGRTLAHGIDVGGFQDDYDSDFEEEITSNLVDTLRGMVPPVWDWKQESGHKLLPVLRTCCYRTTSKIADEIICLASVFNLDVSKLLLIKGDDDYTTLTARRKTFYTLLGDKDRQDPEFDGVPVNVLFMEGPRLSEPGFRWAPIDFLGREPSSALAYGMDPPPAYVLPSGGLEVEMTGWTLDMPLAATTTTTSQSDFWSDPFSFVDEEHDVAYLVDPVGEEWKHPPALSTSMCLVMLREPLLAPFALLVVAELGVEPVLNVEYGWRVRAQAWSLAEFQASATVPEEIQRPAQGSHGGGDDSQLEQSFSGLEIDASATEARVEAHGSEAAKWRGQNRLYEGKMSTQTKWLIL